MFFKISRKRYLSTKLGGFVQMKKVLLILLVFFSFLIVAGNVSAQGKSLYLDGAQLVEGRTLLPLRSIFETLGAEVEWASSTKTVTATKGSTKVVLKINSKQAFINNQTKTLDVPAKLINGKTMVPVRFVSEALGAKVDWDAKKREATITSEDKTIVVGVTEDFIIDKSFLSLAAQGKIKGTRAQLGVGMTLQDIIDMYGQPKQQFNWDGGMGNFYGTFAYFVDAFNELPDNERTLNTIDVWGEDAINMTMKQIKAIIGTPAYEGWSEADDDYVMQYVVGKYTVWFFSEGTNVKVYRLMLK